MGQRRPGMHHLPRPRDLKGHECTPGSAGAAVGDVVIGHAKAGKLVLRQVDAPLGPVHGHVLPVVDKLQAGADGVGLEQVFGLGRPVKVQQQAAYRVGGAAAVILQFGEVRVASLDHVLRKGVQQIAEEHDGQVMGADGAGQPGEHRIGRLGALLDVIELDTVVVQPGQPHQRRRIALVGKIVGAAGKGIDRLHRLAQVCGQEEGGDRKILVMFDGHGGLEAGRRHGGPGVSNGRGYPVSGLETTASRVGAGALEYEGLPQGGEDEVAGGDAGGRKSWREEVQRRVHRVIAQAEGAPMHAHGDPGAHIPVDADGLRRVHMLVAHEPAWLVTAHRELGKIHIAETGLDVAEILGVARVSRIVELLALA